MKKQLLQVAESSKTGARVVQDGQTLLLYDCPEWGERHLELLRHVCPDVEVSMLTCSASLSGFVVRVRVEPKTKHLAWGGLFGVVLAGLVYAIIRLG